MIWEAGRQFVGYQIQMYWGYSSLQDYLWKAPQFIKAEEKIEIAKLFSYFPDAGSKEDRDRNRALRKLRAGLEGQKLFLDFPLLTGEANLFLSLSWFEKHLNRLARFAHDDFGKDHREFPGNGPTRYFKYFKSVGINCNTFESFERVHIAITLRNCLLHATGDLTLSRDSKFIHQVVSREQFLERSRRQSGDTMLDDQNRPEVWIDDDQLGVNYYYAMRVVRDTFALLLNISDKIPSSLHDETDDPP